MAYFLRVIHVPIEKKATELERLVRASSCGEVNTNVFNVSVRDFRLISGMSFIYSAPENLRRLFGELKPLVENGLTVQHGASSKEDFRFLRIWWEVDPASIGSSQTELNSTAKWAAFAKGGRNSPFYSDISLLINWHDNAAEISAALVQKYPYLKGSTGWVLHQENNYFQFGITYVARTTGRFSPRVLPRGCVFAHIGPAIFPARLDLALATLGILSSGPVNTILDLQLSRGVAAGSHQTKAYEMGLLQRLPWPEINHDAQLSLEKYSLEAFHILRMSDSTEETSRAFLVPRLFRTRCASFVEAKSQVDIDAVAAAARLAELQSEIDGIVCGLYGLSPVDLQLSDLSDSAEVDADLEVDDSEDANENVEFSADLGTEVANVLSWCVGIAFGRWDVRFALDPTLLPRLQGPFDPLPRCSPGMLIGPDALPARPGGIVSEAWLRARPDVISSPPEESVAESTISDSAYPLPISWDGLLTEDDLLRRVSMVLQLLWGDRADAIEQEACQALGVSSLREYFRQPKRFFDFHIKRYSKSRRKAPIYWLLQSRNRRYSLWLYYPRLTPDTLFLAGRDHVDTRVSLEANRLDELQAGLAGLAGAARKARERELAVQAELVDELKAFRKTLDQAALLNLKPDLNDGVLLNIAPLRELVPWKEAQKAWDELLKGKYEWSSISQQLRAAGLVKA